MPPAQQKSKNRFVNPEERKQKEDAAQDVLRAFAAAQREPEQDADANTDDADDPEDTGEDEDDTGEAEDWFAALRDVAPGDIFYESDDGNDSTARTPQTTTRRRSNDNGESDGEEEDVVYYNSSLPPEFCCEEIWDDVPPLPKENVPKYPQEDSAYFRSKTEPNYVRTDKISLDSISTVAKTLLDVPLPSMRAIYQDKVHVDTKGW